MKRTPKNTDEEGIAKCIVAGYFKFGAKTLLGWGGSTGTYVMEYDEEETAERP